MKHYAEGKTEDAVGNAARVISFGVYAAADIGVKQEVRVGE